MPTTTPALELLSQARSRTGCFSGGRPSPSRLLLSLGTAITLISLAPLTPALASETPSGLGTEISDIDYKLPPGGAATGPLGYTEDMAQSASGVIAIRGPATFQATPPAPVSVMTAPPQTEAPAAAVYGPQDPAVLQEPAPERRYRSFGSQVARIKWEVLAGVAYYTATNAPKLWRDPVPFHVHSEGWFGKSTADIGVDKLAHAYSAYVLSELYYARLKHKTDNAPGIQFTAAAIGSGITLYTELYDSIEPTSGWSWEDVTFNTLGAGFSVLRNSVPGLDKKLDYRLMIVPNSDIMTHEGKRHFEQQRFFLALKLSGFKRFQTSPLRFLELHLGYYAKDFTNEERMAGVRAKKRVFVGFAVNLRELFFRDSTGWAGRAAGEVLDYWQPPYTAAQFHVTN